jgi:hypothetical protein
MDRSTDAPRAKVANRLRPHGFAADLALRFRQWR